MFLKCHQETVKRPVPYGLQETVKRTVPYRLWHMNKTYSNALKYSDKQGWAIGIDPDHSVPSGAVWSGSTQFAIPSASFKRKYKVKRHCSNFMIITAAIFPVCCPVARLLRLLIFSALNPRHLTIVGSGHALVTMWDKPSSACRWSGIFCRDLPFSPHLAIDLAQNEWEYSRQAIKLK